MSAKTNRLRGLLRACEDKCQRWLRYYHEATTRGDHYKTAWQRSESEIARYRRVLERMMSVKRDDSMRVYAFRWALSEHEREALRRQPDLLAQLVEMQVQEAMRRLHEIDNEIRDDEVLTY